MLKHKKTTENGVHAISFIRDVAEHKRVEEALRAERDKAQRYLDVAQDLRNLKFWIGHH